MRWPYDYRIERVSYSACAYVAAVMPLSGEIMMHSSLLYTVSASKIPTATVKPRPVGTGGRKAMPSPLQTLTYLSVFPISTSAGRYGHHITTPPRFSDHPKALQPNRVGWWCCIQDRWDICEKWPGGGSLPPYFLIMGGQINTGHNMPPSLAAPPYRVDPTRFKNVPLGCWGWVAGWKVGCLVGFASGALRHIKNIIHLDRQHKRPFSFFSPLFFR